ncbi:hypothetical protein T265_10934 [Opisthorchis viverrini]|uniref:phosphatidate cytidylyltransferase n=1 Tax=Opisthorchis viverrini TaxID=6198 RepID=A0A074Z4T9_OPIVI|nr:hypothetical protein T265_10934 [Opisthorchis viverrini]KER20547.1 hypothetical protein T265_10934 [Opisthorchis viverrini]
MSSALPHFSLCVTSDPESMTRGIYGAGVALNPRAERALVDWIPVRLSSPIKLNACRHKKRRLFVVSAYAEKDTFYRELSGLTRQARCTDIVILLGDLDSQVGRLSSLDSHLGGRFGVDVRRTDNGDRLLQLCADLELFLASTNFQHKYSHRVTWWPPTANQPWTQLDHVAISHQWRTTVQDCRSFWAHHLIPIRPWYRGFLGTAKAFVAPSMTNLVLQPTCETSPGSDPSSGDVLPSQSKSANRDEEEDEDMATDPINPDFVAAEKLHQGTSYVPSFITSLVGRLPPRWMNWTVRFFTTIFLISTFSALVYLGPLALQPTCETSPGSDPSSGDVLPSQSKSANRDEEEDEDMATDPINPDFVAAEKLHQGTSYVPSFITSLVGRLPPRWMNWSGWFFTTIFLISTFSALVYLGPLALVCLVHRPDLGPLALVCLVSTSTGHEPHRVRRNRLATEGSGDPDIRRIYHNSLLESSKCSAIRCRFILRRDCHLSALCWEFCLWRGVTRLTQALDIRPNGGTALISEKYPSRSRQIVRPGESELRSRPYGLVDTESQGNG